MTGHVVTGNYFSALGVEPESLGAQPRDVVRLVLREGGWLAIGGIGSGLIGAGMLSRIIASRLYGVNALDPMGYIVAALVLGAVMLAACYVPARGATRVDPAIVLRNE